MFVDVVHGVAHGLQVFEVLVFDTKSVHTVTERFFERLDEFDQRERVGFKVIGEGLAFADCVGFDLENVRQCVTDDFENFVTLDFRRP